MARPSRHVAPRRGGEDQGSSSDTGSKRKAFVSIILSLTMLSFMLSNQATKGIYQDLNNVRSLSSISILHLPTNVSSTDEKKSQQANVSLGSKISPTSGKKTNLVIHVGPPKAATTSMQADLTYLQELEEQSDIKKSNYIYCGSFMHQDDFQKGRRPLLPPCNKLPNRDCWSRISRVYHRNSTTPNNFRQALDAIPCWREMSTFFDNYWQQGMSLIIHGEPLSMNWVNYGGDVGKASINWKLLNYLLQDRWNILVVANYRRLVDWIPSSKQQVDKCLLNKPMANRWPKFGGRVLTPMFTQVGDISFDGPPSWREMARGGTDLNPYYNVANITASVSPHVNMTILNMHDIDKDQHESYTTAFLCNHVPDAKYWCDQSRQRDRVASQTTTLNQGTSLFYDALLVEALDRGLLNITSNSNVLRCKAIAMATKYHERVMNETSKDLPQICPKTEELEEFLKMSLDFEKELLPEFYNSPKGEKAHRANFWKAVAKHKYCWIDLDTALQDTRWEPFFHSLSKFQNLTLAHRELSMF